ncbi:MAG: squalene synthase HpnC [Burkholderiaceae bacterium]|nr:MAG: squalene synthase HpnC [Burkholderiaceae bacterium]
MSIGHYENFPVASILLPQHMRRAVMAIYRFARSADDLADEGDATPEQRLAALNDFRYQLDLIASHQALNQSLFVKLGATIAKHRLSMQPFYDLLSAFAQDVTVQRYETTAELYDYCRRSANPVGRLLLQLYQADTEQNRQWADKICTALQLVNFWQDVAIDLKKDRLYIPLADMRAFQVHVWEVQEGYSGSRWQKLMRYQIGRTRAMLIAGRPLGAALGGRMGYELRVMVEGGLRILEKLEQCDIEVFQHRPTLNKRDWCVMLWRALKK